MAYFICTSSVKYVENLNNVYACIKLIDLGLSRSAIDFLPSKYIYTISAS